MGKRKLLGNVQAQGSKTEASRLDNEHITTNAQGWDLGVRVHGYINPTTGKAEFEVWTTGGSNDNSIKRMIGTATEEGFFYAPPSSR